MKKDVYAYLHTHWDVEWYRSKEDFNIRLLDVLDIVSDELEHNRAPFFYLDGQTIALLEYLKYRDPKKITNLIKQKKLAIGPYFASIDSFMANFNFMLKNLDFGMNISKSYGIDDFIGYMADIFGISKSAFLALQEKNIDKALIWRGVNPDFIHNNCNFKYKSIRASWLVQGYFNDFCHTGNIEGLKQYLDKIAKYSQSNLLLPIGADHLGMLKDANQKIDEINKSLKDYNIILTSPFEYFKNNKFNKNPKCEEFIDNTCTYTLFGVHSARINQKIKNATIQHEITRIVEPLNFYLNMNYQKNLDEIYKNLITNLAHDGISGCSLDCVNNRVDARFKIAKEALESIKNSIISKFKTKYSIKGHSKDKIGLFNLSSLDNIKIIKLKLPYILDNAQVLAKTREFPQEILDDIYQIPVTEDICNIYTQIVEVENNKKFSFNTTKILKPEKQTKASENSIENKYLKVLVQDDIELLDKISKKTYRIKLTDIKDKGDTYNFAPTGEYKILKPENSRILYNGNIESAIRVEYKDIKLDIILNNHTKTALFKSEINNKTKNHKTQFVITLEDKIKKTISHDAIGIVERYHDPDYDMRDFIPAQRPKELFTNSYPNQGFIHTQNVTILNQGLYEYEISKNELRLCLLRAVDIISNPKNPARAIPAGPALLTPEAQCIGIIKSKIGITFGNLERAYMAYEEFLENYVSLDGEFREEINFKLDTIEKNCYFYGINENRKILYNFKNGKILLKEKV